MATITIIDEAHRWPSITEASRELARIIALRRADRPACIVCNDHPRANCEFCLGREES